MIDEIVLRRRSLISALVSGCGALLVLVALGYASVRLKALREEVNTFEGRKDELVRDISQLETRFAQLNRFYKAAAMELDGGFSEHATAQLPVESVDRKSTLRNVDGKRKEALQLAFDLYDKHIPFKWGGKTPSEGLDTSGFVAYILHQVGVLDQPERYWSGLLRQKFGVKIASLSELQPGDLVFEENKACWFLLNDRFTIGMVPDGVMFGEPAKFSSKIIGYGRVPY